MTFQKIKETILQKIPDEIRYIFLLFLSTRLALMIIGTISRLLIFSGNEEWSYSKYPWLDIWGLWDTGWYLSVAEIGYPAQFETGASVYGFFPLYPLLMKVISFLTMNTYFAGLIISNVCLLLLSYFLYKLVVMDTDKDTALRSVKYLFLFPAAFILSGAFTESLFLLLLILCFYFSRQRKWLYVGVCGFLLSLTRITGVLVFVPLFLEYLRGKTYRIKEIKADILFLLLIPAGLLTFFLYCYFRSGRFLAYVTAKQTGWYVACNNPLKFMWENLTSQSVLNSFNASFVIVCLILLMVYAKKIGLPYFILAVLYMLAPITLGGDTVIIGMTRFFVVIFPFFIILAKLSAKRPFLDQSLTIFLAIIQGFLMVFWTCGFKMVQ